MFLLSSKLFHLAVSFILPYTILAQNTWLYPDPDPSTTPSYNYIDTLNASWTTEFDPQPQLILWCSGNDGAGYDDKFNETVPATDYRLFKLNFSETTPQVCHFNIHAQENQDDYLNSGTFNVEIASRTDPITWRPTSPTASASASASTLPPSDTESPSSSSSSSSSSPSSLTPAAKAGIGIGAALGTLALLAGLIYYLRNRRKSKQNQLGGTFIKDPAGYQASEVGASEVQKAPVETDGVMMEAPKKVVGAADELTAVVETDGRVVGELEGGGGVGSGIGRAR